MTTETTCLSSVWQTDGDTKSWLDLHKRADDYRELKPGDRVKGSVRLSFR